MAESADATKALFLSIGFDERRATDTLKNEDLTKTLVEIVRLAGVENGCPKAKGNALYDVATKLGSSPHRDFVVKYIAEDKINGPEQLKEAISFLQSAAEVSAAAFENAAGIGAEVSDELISAKIAEVIAQHADALKQQRYAFPKGKLLGQLKQVPELKWGFAKVSGVLDQQINDILGPRTAEDDNQAKSKGKGKDAGASASKPEPKKEAKKNALVRPEGDFPFIKLSQIPQHEDKLVEVRGWVHNIRTQSNIIFIELRDGTGFVQVVLAGKGLVNSEGSSDLIREATIEVLGKVSRPPPEKYAKWSGLELEARYWRLIGKSDVDLEDKFNDQSKPSILFDQRHLVIRQEKVANYLKLKSVVSQKMREHYFDRGYFEVTPPTIVQTQAEGGSELFTVDYFGQPAYLTQSSQLYLETTCPAVGKCFCLLSSYRAEPSRTRRHLSEYQHLEAELPFITFNELLESIEDLICDSLQRVLDSPYGPMLREINPNIAVPKRPFKRMDYTDAITWLKEHNVYKDEEAKTFYEFGDDIPEKPERFMTDSIGEPIFMCRFPVQCKAFYMPKCPEDPLLTESTDLLMPGVGEIVGGSMRIWQYEELMAAYKREGLDPAPYYWFTDQRKYGSFPHGGYGLGMERLLTWMFNEYHIRNVCLYPRYIGRCSP